MISDNIFWSVVVVCATALVALNLLKGYQADAREWSCEVMSKYELQLKEHQGRAEELRLNGN